MKKQLDRIFQLREEKTSIKQELLAGVIGFFYCCLHHRS